MIGRTIEGRNPSSKLAWPMTILAICSGAAALAGGGYHAGMAAAFPAMLATLAWVFRPAITKLQVEEDALLVLGNGRVLRYAELLPVYVGAVPLAEAARDGGDGPIYFGTATTRVILPEQLNVDRTEFLQFLVERIPPRTNREPPAVLAAYVAEQVEKFGSEKVVVIHQQDRPRQRNGSRATLLVGLALIMAGVSWMSIATVLRWGPTISDGELWTVVGGFSVFFGFFVTLLGAVGNVGQRQHSKVKNACVVIGPAGIAVSQGDVKGSMPWEEILGVNRPAKSLLGIAESITLKVAGGRIVLFDVYSCSPAELSRLIQQRRGVTLYE